MSSRIHSINVSRGGVPKLPVPDARVTRAGLEGDVQRNKRHHGGPNRAVCLYSLERIEELRREGHPIAPGAVGENLTIAGVDWDIVLPGIVIRAGGAELQVTSFTEPCKTIRKSFQANNIERIAQDRFPGWSRVYAKVLEEGLVRVGDAVVLTAVGVGKSANLNLFGDPGVD